MPPPAQYPSAKDFTQPDKLKLAVSYQTEVISTSELRIRMISPKPTFSFRGSAKRIQSYGHLPAIGSPSPLDNVSLSDRLFLKRSSQTEASERVPHLFQTCFAANKPTISCHAF